MGYSRAGFEVVGVDASPQPHFPFEFHEADAMTFPLEGFDAIHASPPCQAYSVTRNLWPGREHPDLVAPTRDRLRRSGVPWVIENVPGSPLIDPVQLCGSSFGLDVRRHRWFEASFVLLVPDCQHGWQVPRFATQISQSRAKVRKQRLASVVSVAGNGTEFYDAGVVHVHGNGGGKGGIELWRAAMGIDWMNRRELAQAIPPAYTELIGWQLVAQLGNAATTGNGATGHGTA